MGRAGQALLDGALGGLAGTATMSVLMLAARAAGLTGALPPEALAGAGLAAGGAARPAAETKDAAAVALHFGFGGGVGALYGLFRRRLRPPVSAPLEGCLLGSLIWFVSYKGWVPALGIMPPPERDRPGRPVTMLLAHWIYGWTLVAILDRRQRQAPR